MKHIKFTKAMSLLISGVLLSSAFAACVGGGDDSSASGLPPAPPAEEVGFDYETEMLSEIGADGYNSNLFYVNNLDFEIADPTVIQITDEDDDENFGYFYAYGTSDDIIGNGFQAWRSKDLSHWECTGIAFQPDHGNTWASYNYWAPEVIYDAAEDLYYLFYNADNFNVLGTNGIARMYMSVAVSENPAGPFVSPDGMRNADGEQLRANVPVFDFTTNNPKVASVVEDTGLEVRANTLDAHPFVDKNGQKYLYFGGRNDSEASNYDGTHIYGVKMKDWFTPDYSTLKQLTYQGYKTVADGLEGIKNRVSEGNINEGPFMMEHEGKYYLTYSIYGMHQPTYRVMQAVGDGPLGTFTKLDQSEGGVVVSTAANWTHITTAGHHCFIKCGNETYIAYHTYRDRTSLAKGRALAVDKIVWVENSAGLPVMHTNGPTWSVQALPESVSGYKNIAASANITADKTAADSNKALLNDGVIKYQDSDCATEYTANAGKSTIKLSWNQAKTARAIMVYNSYDFEKTFVSVDKVQIEYLKADGSTATVEIKDLAFDWDWSYEPDYEFMRPGGAAIAEFAELPVKSITIVVSTADGAEELALGEIVVLGKDQACAGVNQFADYSYTNPTHGSAYLVNESRNFGNWEDAELETMYGYDLKHDDGTANAYITQNSVGQQEAYFNNVYATDFYVEAEFTVTESEPYHVKHKNSEGDWVLGIDPDPKFGIVVSCGGEGQAENKVFYYVDAKGFALSKVGCAQRKASGKDWDWSETEKTTEVDTISYTNNAYVKLAILREGDTFYFICEGEVVLTVDDFNVFTDTQKAAVGFLSFNTGLKIKNYKATADASAIAAAKTQYDIN